MISDSRAAICRLRQGTKVDTYRRDAEYAEEFKSFVRDNAQPCATGFLFLQIPFLTLTAG